MYNRPLISVLSETKVCSLNHPIIRMLIPMLCLPDQIKHCGVNRQSTTNSLSNTSPLIIILNHHDVSLNSTKQSPSTQSMFHYICHTWVVGNLYIIVNQEVKASPLYLVELLLLDDVRQALLINVELERHSIQVVVPNPGSKDHKCQLQIMYQIILLMDFQLLGCVCYH